MTTKPIETETDPEDLAAIVEDVRRGLQFIRNACGFGEILMRIHVRPKGIANWEVAPQITRKPQRDS